MIPLKMPFVGYRSLLVLFLLLQVRVGYSQPGGAKLPDTDPFQTYLTGKAPEIEEDLGTETTPEGIRVHRLVFRSRLIETPQGPQPSLVFAAIAFPAGKGPHPAIVRLHGGGGGADIPAAVSSALQGYVSLVLDIPGVAGGKNKHPKTTGPWLTRPKIGAHPDATHSCLFDAVLASVQSFYLLRAQPEVDPSKMGVAGASWGGYTATMVAGLINDDLAATWAVYGSGNFEAGAFEKENINRLPASERETWLTYLDPGRRAYRITKPYFIATASNDRHWSWMAVQATLAQIKGPVNQLYSPNDNHVIKYPGTNGMIPFFNHYLKKTGPPLPKVISRQVKRLKDDRVQVQVGVSDYTKLVAVKVYYSVANPSWTERNWMGIDAQKAGRHYKAIIPADAAGQQLDWYAIVTDENLPAWGTDHLSTSSLIRPVD